MRAGYGLKILKDKNDVFYGIRLEAAHVAEHEWGIRSLHRTYGVSAVVNEENTGYETCLNTIFPENQVVLKDFTADGEQYTMLISLNTLYTKNEIKLTKSTLQDFEIYPYAGGMRCAWDEHSFGIVVPKENKDYIEEIYNALKNNECVMIIDLGELKDEENLNPFAKNYGLCLMINSKIPEKLKSQRAAKDLDRYKLYKAMAETGIEKTLKDAGKSYFALSPRWKDETKTELIFWLNPMHQHLYNFGWMTIEDLLDWTQDKGKVMKN